MKHQRIRVILLLLLSVFLIACKSDYFTTKSIALFLPDDMSTRLESKFMEEISNKKIKAIIDLSGDVNRTVPKEYNNASELNNDFIEIFEIPLFSKFDVSLKITVDDEIIYEGKTKDITVKENQVFVDLIISYVKDSTHSLNYTVEEFIETLGSNVRTLTADSTEKGLTVSDDGLTANAYGIKLSGEFSSNNSLPSSLTSIDFTGIDTSGVTSMNSMFANIKATSMNLSTLDTSNVTDMHKMFNSCFYLESIDVSSFDTSKVTDMSEMFSLCDNLAAVDVSGFNTSNVTTMKKMFYYDQSLAELDLSNFDTSKVTDMSEMFYSCEKLDTLDITPFNTENVTTMREMFTGCKVLKTIYASEKFVIQPDTDTYRLFMSCDALVGRIPFDSSHYDGHYAHVLGYFSQHEPIYPDYTVMTVKAFIEELGTTVTTITANNTTLGITKSEDETIVNINKVLLIEEFSSDNKFPSTLETADLSGLETKYVDSMLCMFYNCSNLTTLNISSLNTENVTSMAAMFQSCSKLTNIDLSKLNTSKVTDMSSMFNGCSALTALDLSNFDTSNVETLENIFSYCTTLEKLNLSNVNTSNVTNMSGMFYYCQKLLSFDLDEFDTRKVTDMSKMFNYCKGVTSLDLSSFDTSNVTNVESMFSNATNVETIYVSNTFVTTKIVSSLKMFTSCTKLHNGEITYDRTKVTADMANTTTGYFTLKE